MIDNSKMIISLLIVSAPIVILIITIIYDNLSGNAKRREMQHWRLAPDLVTIQERVSLSGCGWILREIEFDTKEEYLEAHRFCVEKEIKERELKRERDQWKENVK